jgi:hypothetical protein
MVLFGCMARLESWFSLADGSLPEDWYSRSFGLAVYGGALKGNGSISYYGSLQVNDSIVGSGCSLQEMARLLR